eukprot:403357833
MSVVIVKDWFQEVVRRAQCFLALKKFIGLKRSKIYSQTICLPPQKDNTNSNFHETHDQSNTENNSKKYKQIILKQLEKYKKVKVANSELNSQLQSYKSEQKRLRDELQIVKDLLVKEQLKVQELQRNQIKNISREASIENNRSLINQALKPNLIQQDEIESILDELVFIQQLLLNEKPKEEVFESIEYIQRLLKNKSKNVKIRSKLQDQVSNLEKQQKIFLKQVQERDAIFQEKDREIEKLNKFIPQYKRQVAYMRQNIDQMRQTVSDLNENKLQIMHDLDQEKLKFKEVQVKLQSERNQHQQDILEMQNQMQLLLNKIEEQQFAQQNYQEDSRQQEMFSFAGQKPMMTSTSQLQDAQDYQLEHQQYEQNTIQNEQQDYVQNLHGFNQHQEIDQLDQYLESDENILQKTILPKLNLTQLQYQIPQSNQKFSKTHKLATTQYVSLIIERYEKQFIKEGCKREGIVSIQKLAFIKFFYKSKIYKQSKLGYILLEIQKIKQELSFDRRDRIPR